MKRCPQCNRTEADDTLTFCRADGTPLVRESGVVSDGAGTLRLSPEGSDTGETRILPTGEASGRPTVPTTVLDARPAPGNMRELSKPKSRRGVVIALAAVAALALAAYAYFSSSRGRVGGAKNSIAVLPFHNESGDPDVEYLSDGMTESLINSLSPLPNLAVKARSTVFRYKGKDADPQKVGSELNVQAVLSGRVVQRGDDLTLSLELVDVGTGDQIWGEQYNRRVTDLVTLQREVARDVSGKLKVKLSGADEQKVAKNYTQDTEAYQLYLKGRYHWNKRTPQGIQKAIEYFQQAIALDPNYALAYTGLADAYALLSNYGGSPPHETKPKAREAALKALSLDEGLAEAHTALGLILHEYDYDFAGAERAYKRAIELNPNYATAHQFLGESLTHRGRHEEAFAEFRRALEIDPLSLTINRLYGESMTFARRYDEAVTQLKKTIELDTNFATAHVSLSTVYQLKDNYAESVEELVKFQELIGEQENAALIRESFAQGDWEGFLRAMTGTRRPVNFPSYIVATFHAERGEKNKAFAELNKSYENREYFMVLLKVDPRLDPLRSDPRFADLMRKVGLPQ